MQVQANDVIDKMTERLAQLMKEGIIMESHLEFLVKQHDQDVNEIKELKDNIEELTKKLKEKEDYDLAKQIMPPVKE